MKPLDVRAALLGRLMASQAPRGLKKVEAPIVAPTLPVAPIPPPVPGVSALAPTLGKLPMPRRGRGL